MQPSASRTRRILASVIYKDYYPFDTRFDLCVTVTKPEQLDGVSTVLIWGGEDISPSIYGQEPAPNSGPRHPSARDQIELSVAHEAIRRGIPIIGICRGSQLMCAVSGGTLIQHTTGHAGPDHVLETSTGKFIPANSTHHQMMNPDGVDHQLLAWVDPARSDRYIGSAGAPAKLPKGYKETEVVYFPKTKALCIQGHPEYLERENPFTKYALELVDQFILNRPGIVGRS